VIFNYKKVKLENRKWKCESKYVGAMRKNYTYGNGVHKEKTRGA